MRQLHQLDDIGLSLASGEHKMTHNLTRLTFYTKLSGGYRIGTKGSQVVLLSKKIDIHTEPIYAHPFTA